MSRILFVTLFLALLQATRAEATIIAYNDEKTLFGMADVVVHGKVWSQQVISVKQDLFTVYEVEVLEAFKGLQKGQFVTVYSPGGVGEDGTEEILAGAPRPKVGNQVIVFLRHNTLLGGFSILSLALGHYELNYDAIAKRYIAHREVNSVVALRPSPGRGLPDQAVIIPPDRLAKEFIEELRGYAGKGGAK